MNDIFLSYASADHERARQLAEALERLGWSVWWDREIPPGKTFDQVIEEELNGARCVIVLWSKESVRSRWVKTEASAAAEKDRLIPVLIDDVAIPFEFKRIQAARLLEWYGTVSHEEFDRLVRAIKDVLGQPDHSKSSVQKVTHVTQPGRKTAGALALVAAAVVATVLVVFLGKSAFQRTKEVSDAQNAMPGSAGSLNSDASPGSRPSLAEVKPAAPKGAFTVKIGDKIGDGIPAPGAGSVEKPFAEDAYVFTASPRQKVYFRMLEHSAGMHQTAWRLTDEVGMQLFNSCLGCGDPEVQTLIKGGTYTMTVGGGSDPATGTYRLQLFDVPASDKFPIRIGDRIKDGVPQSGAGFIDRPGAQDIYTFTAAPRQKVYFRMLEHSPGMLQIRWRVVDEDGMEVFSTCLGCGDPGVQTLIKGGTYTMTVGSRNDPATGTYALELGRQ